MFAYFGRFKLYNQGEEEISMKKGRGWIDSRASNRANIWSIFCHYSKQKN
jgi:hypothetical protein